MRAPCQPPEAAGEAPCEGDREAAAPDVADVAFPEEALPGAAAPDVADVAVVATKGRWIDRSCLVVEVELSIPATFSLARWALMTESVQAAVLSVIGEPGPASPQLARPSTQLSWLSVSPGASTSTTTAALRGGRP
jgi:hypothetical protein